MEIKKEELRYLHNLFLALNKCSFNDMTEKEMYAFLASKKWLQDKLEAALKPAKPVEKEVPKKPAKKQAKKKTIKKVSKRGNKRR